MLMHVFERIHFFLERLNTYVGIPLTNEFTRLLGKIMAQLLSILALSTKAMAEGRISKLMVLVWHYWTDYGIEKYLKRLVGRTEVEDALSQLDTLTKEESLMTVARTLEVTHVVDGNVKATKALIEDIDDNMGATKELVHEVDGNIKEMDHNVRTTKNGIQHFLFIFAHPLTPTFSSFCA